MYKHYEFWTWNGKDWNRCGFLSEPKDTEMNNPYTRAYEEYNRHKRVMPKCPAKLVRVVAEDEFYGQG